MPLAGGASPLTTAQSNAADHHLGTSMPSGGVHAITVAKMQSFPRLLWQRLRAGRTDHRLLGSSWGVDQRPELRFERLEKLHRQTARKVIAAGALARHIGRDRAEKPVAQEKHKGGGAVDHARRNQPAPGRMALIAVVTGAGFAADH